MSERSIEDLVNLWLALDKNPSTRAEIEELWAARDTAQLEKRLRTRIAFGTAGLRGRMEAGFSRMNDLLIIQVSQGLCAYVLGRLPDVNERGIVVGHDHRHQSAHWARLVAAVFVKKGVRVYLHRGLVHTPMVPFSVKTLASKPVAGVMITASHNPKDDNGYKVYWENAVQIISPHDTGIARAIEGNLTPWLSSSWKEEADSVLSSPLCVDATQQMHDQYFALVKSLSPPGVKASTGLRFVTTPMHGVGHRPVFEALSVAGFSLDQFIPVKEQKEPDPDFPTVPFPNPEEKGALALAIKAAEASNANYVLAQDPDADRFAAAERKSDGAWHIFSGDQLGGLFAARALGLYQASGAPMNKLAMVASTVSSKMMESMAEHEGFKFVDCLTGFKFIGNVALQLEKEGYSVPFGYEEAIGYMISNDTTSGNEIRDKDGVTATVAFVDLVTGLHMRGSSATQYLQELYARYGYFQTSNSYFVCADPAKIDAIFDHLRHFPGENVSPTRAGAVYPQTIGGLRIRSTRDLTTGFGYDSSSPPSFTPSLPLSGGHMITFRAGDAITDGAAITLTIRTSGTEPKIKYYLEGKGQHPQVIGKVLGKVVEELRSLWMEAEVNGLEEP